MWSRIPLGSGPHFGLLSESRSTSNGICEFADRTKQNRGRDETEQWTTWNGIGECEWIGSKRRWQSILKSSAGHRRRERNTNKFWRSGSWPITTLTRSATDQHRIASGRLDCRSQMRAPCATANVRKLRQTVHVSDSNADNSMNC